MIPFRLLLILAIALSLALVGGVLGDRVFAQTATEAARSDGKAFGRQKASAAQSDAVATPDATRLPNFSDTPPQSAYFDNPDQMAGASATQATSHQGYQAVQNSQNTRARFDLQQLKDSVARGKAVAADPNQFASGMSGSTGNCVPLPPSVQSPGRYTATCNTGFTIDQTPKSCRVPLAVSITSKTSYSYYAEVGSNTGFMPILQDFQAGLVDGTCTDTGPTDMCQVVRAYGLTPNKKCSQYRADIIVCTAPIAAPSGTVFPATGQFWFATATTSSAVTAPDQSGCAGLNADPQCNTPVETCTDASPPTRIVNGVSVTAPCWAWDRTYQCSRTTDAQDCSALDADTSCRLVGETCLTGNLPCLTTERVYDCALPAQPTGVQQYICDGDIYCINGECETIVREANSEFKDAVVALNAIEQARGEFDPNTLTLFKGERGTCSSKVFGVLNCCKGKGFPLIPGISLLVALGCDSQEVLLHQRDAQGLCTYVGTYCSDKVLGICVTKKKAYCCYESKLTRIIQEQGRPQLGKVWASPKTEQCAGFTLDEFSQLDLSVMDFSEVYAEFTDAVRVPDELATLTDIQQKIGNFYAQNSN
jgi:conjugal transfer mating pair stabilization protein TraN